MTADQKAIQAIEVRPIYRHYPANFRVALTCLHDHQKRLFDDIAENARTKKDVVLARKQLDALMNNCIACHAIYRLHRTSI